MIAAAGLWTIVVLIAVLFFGGQVYMCLGPTGVTEDSCRAANGIPPLTDWDRFTHTPAFVALLLVAGWAAIGAAVWWKRQRAGL